VPSTVAHYERISAFDIASLRALATFAPGAPADDLSGSPYGWGIGYRYDWQAGNC